MRGSSDEMGSAGTPEPTTDRDPPETDPESYDSEPEGPTTSTED
jgi:hypothetical protein